MSKIKTRKSVEKRIKVTSSGKLLRRHQLGAGTYRTNKSKSALERYKKTTEVNKGYTKRWKRALGI